MPFLTMKKYSWDVDTERTESDKRYAVNDKIDIWNIDIGCVIIFFTAYGSPLCPRPKFPSNSNFEETEINFLPCHMKSDKQKSAKYLVILFG